MPVRPSEGYLNFPEHGLSLEDAMLTYCIDTSCIDDKLLIGHDYEAYCIVVCVSSRLSAAFYAN